MKKEIINMIKWNEKWYLEEKISNRKREIITNLVEKAHKYTGLDLSILVNIAMDNEERIENMDMYELLDQI